MPQPRRPRHPASGGYARGDETRQRIIAAALNLFGERGYDGASTREIASAAGVNAPALQYYFQNKEGVYRACAEHLLEALKRRFEGATSSARTALATEGPDASIRAYMELQAVGLDLALSAERVTYARMFGRELAGDVPGFAASLLDREIKQPMNRLMRELLGRVTGQEPEAAITRIRQLTLKGLIQVFHYPPGACLEALQWDDLAGERAQLIKQAVSEQTLILLQAWANQSALP
ncbi:CerR family C-terminal domain-containing protein [Frateuria aurantia]